METHCKDSTMFKYWSIKRYGSKLLPLLEKKYGCQAYYHHEHIKLIINKYRFNKEYVPLAYLLFVEPNRHEQLFKIEFPHLNIDQYKNEMLHYLTEKKYKGYLLTLASG